MPSRIRKGDLIEVIAGREKGKRGTVLRMLSPQERVGCGPKKGSSGIEE